MTELVGYSGLYQTRKSAPKLWLGFISRTDKYNMRIISKHAILVRLARIIIEKLHKVFGGKEHWASFVVQCLEPFVPLRAL